MSINRSGFELTNVGLQIDKDVEAQLIYSFNWSEWLDTGDTIQSSEYSVAARRNDPTPLTIASQGVQGTAISYVELAGGQVDKTYIVTAKVTTSNGLIDRRSFRINVTNRMA